MSQTRIKPALTPEEWTAFSGGDDADLEEFFARKPPWGLRLGDYDGCIDLQLPQSMSSLVAIANAALPDGDSRKFTHADVKLLRYIADVFFATDPDDGPALTALSDKIAALLPPA